MDRADRGSDEMMDERPETSAEGFALPRPSPTLAALTTSALALPGIAGPARADAPIERAFASSSFSYYFEDSLSPRDFLDDGNGSRDRYDVYTGQFRFDLPVSDRVDVGLDFLYEEMSGASPWFVSTNTDGRIVQVMSGATIEDERFDAVVDVDFFMDNGKDTFSTGVSNENDYFSYHFGIGAERNFNDKNTVLNVSGAFAYNWIDPTDAEIFQNRPESEENWTIDLFAGLSQIITRSSTAQVTINYKHSDGYLADPYKEIQVLLAANLSDERPDTKEQVSILARYRHHIEAWDSSVHADYRFYADDWGVVSHTVELAWYQQFLEYFTVAPSFRWYSQSKADFYDTLLPSGTNTNATFDRSSDFRLSPYGAISAKIKFEFELTDLVSYRPPAFLERFGFGEGIDLIGAISYERYLSSGQYSIVSVSDEDEAPGLVNFQVVAVTISGRF